MTAAAFLRRAVAHYRAYGIRVERVMTDNGSCYRGPVHALACRMLGLRHLRTRPYRPRTNGKAERFIRTMLGGWAYGAIYGNWQEPSPVAGKGKTAALWATDADSYLCDAHALGGAKMTLLFEPDSSRETTLNVVVTDHAGERTLPIKG